MTRPRAPRPWPLVYCAALATLTLGSIAGCTHDLVLPDQVAAVTCGDGVIEGDESCDVDSPGCDNCQIKAGWACTSTGCVKVTVEAGVEGGAEASAAPPVKPCDLNGFWAARETTYLRDEIFDTVQVSSNWYLYEIGQTNDSFALTASLDCGVHVTGSATIDYPPATLAALVWQNPEDGTDATRGQRQGTSAPSANGCAVTMAPWYFVRGVTTDYLPASFAADPALDGLNALPSVSDPVNGTVFPPGATDPTTPGIPGVGTVISGLVPGRRYSAQRSMTAFAGPSSETTASGAPRTVVIQGTFDVQENVLRVTDCGASCSLLTTIAVPATDLPPHTTLQYLGATLTAPDVAAVVVAAPRANNSQDVQTCLNVQAILPHDGTVPK